MVNYWAVLVAAVVSMVIGFLWYGPFFGKQWMKWSKAPKKKPKGSAMARDSILGLINTFVMLAVLALLYMYVGVVTLAGGMWIAFLVWLGFVATTTMGTVLWEKKPFRLWLLNNVYSLLVLLISGAILVAW